VDPAPDDPTHYSLIVEYYARGQQAWIEIHVMPRGDGGEDIYQHPNLAADLEPVVHDDSHFLSLYAIGLRTGAIPWPDREPSFPDLPF
jgi:hypothetical protein